MIGTERRGRWVGGWVTYPAGLSAHRGHESMGMGEIRRSIVLGIEPKPTFLGVIHPEKLILLGRWVGGWVGGWVGE